MAVDVAAEQGVPGHTVIHDVMTAPEGDRTLCIQFIIDEADIEENLRHPLMMVGSDGIPDLRGRPHPRLFGTFPKVLGHYVRDQGVMILAEAVRRMTSLSCDRFGLVDRGRIVEGQFADLVVFDPDTVIDTATYDDPKQEATGIDMVIVNGRRWPYGTESIPASAVVVCCASGSSAWIDALPVDLHLPIPGSVVQLRSVCDGGSPNRWW